MISCWFLLIIVLFWKAKVLGRGKFNEDFLSLNLSKRIQGFCAVCIVMHHFVQQFVLYGDGIEALGIFSDIGFLFVGIFFFFSGYGLYKSYKIKPHYLNNFLKKRLPVVLVPLYIVNTILTVIVLTTGSKIYNDMNPLAIGMNSFLYKITTFLAITLMNSNAWYMITITMFYIVFYVAFKNYSNEERALKAILVFSVIYAAVGIFSGFGFFWFQGEWWYNSSFLFIIGLYFAKHENAILIFIKEKYAVFLTGSVIGVIIMMKISIVLINTLSYYRPGIEGKVCSIICLIFQTAAAITFVSAFLIITMKVRINNPILDFLGRIGLEIYLVHRFFIVAFNSQVLTISNNELYLAVVYICSIITAFVLHKIDNVIVKKIKI